MDFKAIDIVEDLDASHIGGKLASFMASYYHNLKQRGIPDGLARAFCGNIQPNYLEHIVWELRIANGDFDDDERGISDASMQEL